MKTSPTRRKADNLAGRLAAFWQALWSRWPPDLLPGANVTGAGVTSIGFLLIPGGTVAAGSGWEIDASGFFSTGSGVPSGASVYVYWGGISGTQLIQLQFPSGSIPASASNLGWFANARVKWLSKTVAEVRLMAGWHTAAGTATSVVWFAVTSTSGLSTSGDENLSLAFSWGSAPGGQQLACDTCTISQVS